MKSKSVILLSGGLDSLVALGLTKNNYNVSLALTFDYGQNSAHKEISQAKKMCELYNINHKIIKLDWLNSITHNFLTKKTDLPFGIQNNAKAFWVPNRNGLFLNIAACYADAENYNFIIFGANKEEAQNFSDNTKQFVENINKEFKYSTMNGVKVLAPLINFNKDDIVKQAIENKMPLELVYSCYGDFEKNCGKCESCIRLKNALITNNAKEYIGILFNEN